MPITKLLTDLTRASNKALTTVNDFELKYLQPTLPQEPQDQFKEAPVKEKAVDSLCNERTINPLKLFDKLLQCNEDRALTTLQLVSEVVAAVALGAFIYFRRGYMKGLTEYKMVKAATAAALANDQTAEKEKGAPKADDTKGLARNEPGRIEVVRAAAPVEAMPKKEVIQANNQETEKAIEIAKMFADSAITAIESGEGERGLEQLERLVNFVSAARTWDAGSEIVHKIGAKCMEIGEYNIARKAFNYTISLAGHISDAGERSFWLNTTRSAAATALKNQQKETRELRNGVARSSGAEGPEGVARSAAVERAKEIEQAGKGREVERDGRERETGKKAPEGPGRVK